MATPNLSRLIAELRRAPMSSAASLLRALELGSQATLSRLVTRAGPQVVPVGRARARRYAAARDIRAMGFTLPLFRVNRDGTLEQIAVVRPIYPNGIVVEGSAPLPRWMQGQRGDGVFAGLPVYLADRRPHGFLGRTFARRNAELDLPNRLEDWSDDDVMVALAKAGEDTTGDLLLGDASARRLYAQWAAEPVVVPLAERSQVYPVMAEEAIGGVLPGSSAGGQQPKFGAITGDRTSPVHVIVKFSPADNSAAALRWRDLLVCEYLASQALRGLGFQAVDSEILEGASRTFLQTTRFDRIGARGRLPVVSLFALNNEYIGTSPGAGNWLEAAARLERDRWLPPSAVAQVRGLHWFGQFIANTDMHFGNLSLLPQWNGEMALAPAYDMLPMHYAPVGNDLPQRPYVPPLPVPGQESAWTEGGERGIGFWETVARDKRISGAFRATAAQNAAAIRIAVARFLQR